MRSGKAEVAVLGAGVVGLSTALAILEDMPSTSVSILADAFLSETLSFGAGGYFRPEANIGPDRETVQRWAASSYERYSYLAVHEPVSSGNSFVSGYQLSSYSPAAVRNSLVESVLPPGAVRQLGEKELGAHFPCRFKHGIFWTSIVTDPRYYLPYLHERISAAGGRFQQLHVDSFEELLSGEKYSHYDVIVNCTGLSAAKLTGDHLLTPIRGQTIKVRAPWIRHFYFADGAYIIPGRDYVTLGGIKDYGNGNMALSELDRESIWKRCTELVPSLAQAEVAFEWVGLRPQRQPVRVELEEVELKEGSSASRRKVVKVVHNYGHGGHGITLSWGTAKDASSLVAKALLKSKL